MIHIPKRPLKLRKSSASLSRSIHWTRETLWKILMKCSAPTRMPLLRKARLFPYIETIQKLQPSIFQRSSRSSRKQGSAPLCFPNALREGNNKPLVFLFIRNSLKCSASNIRQRIQLSSLLKCSHFDQNGVLTEGRVRF